MPLNKNRRNPGLKFNPVLALIGLRTTGPQTTRQDVFRALTTEILVKPEYGFYLKYNHVYIVHCRVRRNSVPLFFQSLRISLASSIIKIGVSRADSLRTHVVAWISGKRGREKCKAFKHIFDPSAFDASYPTKPLAMHAGYLAKWFWTLDFNAFSLGPYPFRVTEVLIFYPLVQFLGPSSVNSQIVCLLAVGFFNFSSELFVLCP